MRNKAVCWYVDDGRGLEFPSLAALRFAYSNLSPKEKRDVLGFPVKVIRMDKSCETYGYMDFRCDYPENSKACIRSEPPEN